jgi:serine/threonine protein kinase
MGIVTEYLPGGTLEDHILSYRGKPLPSLIAFRSLVETVAELHDDSIFHRDIKPANIFVVNDGSLILGDFGIAFLPNLPERLTFTNESVGPRNYMPAWAEAEERLEKVAGNFDVYELGTVLWCMIAGRLKLVREWYKRPEFDLTVKFRDDPQMHMINAILDKCLNEVPEKCLPRASELLPWVDAHLSVMRRGGQMLRDGVPRPCRVCGTGFYQPTQTVGLPIYVSMEGGGWRHEGAFNARLRICDYCGNVELFKT